VVTSGRAARRPSRVDRVLGAVPKIRTRVLATAERQTNEKSYGNYPAPTKVLEVVRVGYEQGAAAGLAAERKAIAELGETDAGRNLLRLFFLKQGAAKAAFAGITAKPNEIKHAAVTGGGTMGAG